MAKPPSSKGLKVKVEVDKGDVAAIQRAHKAHLAEVERETAQVTERHARGMVTAIRAHAAAQGGQASLAAQSVRYASSNPPTISAAGSGMVHPSRSSHLPSGGDVFYGSEFGGGGRKRTRQFPRRRRTGYWFFPTLKAASPRLRRNLEQALERAARRWGTGG